MPAAGENCEDSEVFIEFKPIFLQSGIDLSYLKCLRKYTELPDAGKNFEDSEVLSNLNPFSYSLAVIFKAI